MTEHVQNNHGAPVGADLADIEASLYELHLRIRDLTARHLHQGPAARSV